MQNEKILNYNEFIKFGNNVLSKLHNEGEDAIYFGLTLSDNNSKIGMYMRYHLDFIFLDYIEVKGKKQINPHIYYEFEHHLDPTFVLVETILGLLDREMNKMIIHFDEKWFSKELTKLLFNTLLKRNDK
jgi:hypothetical protein